MMKAYFIITIDTEGDNLWSVTDIRQKVTVENSKYLLRFQELCEKYGLIPTYLTNYEMANAPAMIEMGREGLKKGTLEIGAHEHSWNQPPYYPLVGRPGKRGKPFLAEYPRPVIRRKIEYLTNLLQDKFQTDITSHRGGRWCLNRVIVEDLEALGYLVDCTCTPGIDWSKTKGWSIGSCGTDWSRYPDRMFVFKRNKKPHKLEGGILEVPVTIRKSMDGSDIWLRPNGNNLNAMMAIVNRGKAEKRRYLEFMIHSSELMPGGSPTFSNKWQIEKLYRDMDILFAFAREKGFYGISLSSFAKFFERNWTGDDV